MRCNLYLHKVNWLKVIDGEGVTAAVVILWWCGGEDNDSGVYSGKSKIYYSVSHHSAP